LVVLGFLDGGRVQNIDVAVLPIGWFPVVLGGYGKVLISWDWARGWAGILINMTLVV
jgi:hypothetical protein